LKRKIFSVLIALMLVCSFSLVTAVPVMANGEATVVDLHVEPSTGTTVNVGDTFSLEIWARFSVSGQWIMADVVFQWDPDYLQLDGGTASFPGHPINATWDDGDAAIVTMQWPPATEDICMVTLNFTALAPTSSTTFNIVRNATAFPSGPPTTLVVDAVTFQDCLGNLYGAEVEIVTAEIEVEIDIKLGSDPNSINLKSKGVVPVAVLTTDDFDASTVDPETVLFAGASPVRSTLEDVDGDDNLDMLFHFKTQELNLESDATDATLTGKTLDGIDIAGTDMVNIVPKGK